MAQEALSAMRDDSYDPHSAYKEAKEAMGPDTTPGWEALLDTLGKQDDRMIDAWKDELNNLLIFAGLFSAVVTAFTVESYSWLQQDPGDTNSELLARISQQLSSLSSGAGYVNSTVPALSLDDARSFAPTSVSVNVNILWILSLTLSLLAAFFAIAVQQWLRHLPLPPGITLREAVRLQQFRQEGLHRWQVPGIVSLLPILLQVAVVFFFAGLLLLLQSLNRTIALLFSVVPGTGLLTVLGTTFIPILSPRCPYKTPLIPTALTVLQWCSYPITLLLCGLGFAIDLVFRAKPVENMLFRHGYWVVYRNLYHRRLEHLQRYVREFGLHIYVNINDFWTNLEIHTLLDKDSQVLDSAALSRGLASARSDIFSLIQTCLQDLSESSKIACVRNAISSSPINLSEDNMVSFALGHSVPTGLVHSERLLSSRHQDMIVATFPSTLIGSDDFYTRNDISHFLIVLRFLNRSSTPSCPNRRFYARLLFNLRTHQRFDSRSWWWTGKRVLATLLYEESCQYPFTRAEALLAVAWAQEVLKLGNHPDAEWVLGYTWLHASCTILVSAATGLTALAKQRSLNSEDTFQLARLLRSLNHFLAKYKQSIITAMNERRDESEESTLIVSPHAITAICRSLAEFAGCSCLPQGANCPSRTLEVHLREICGSPDDKRFMEARRHLRRFRRADTRSEAFNLENLVDRREHGSIE